ncbi:hypothetical protein [Massilia sp. TN1-12]|uniref:hypothetical protein n=1 Tax=Massilia paldalensis TaxID=3377675 RepID=UPI00384A615D
MTSPGQRTAKPPCSPYANLAAVERAGVTKHGSAIWRLVCTCGESVEADAPAIKRGAARCPDCNPSYGDLEAQRILAVLPATIAETIRRSGMTLAQVRYRLELMKPDLCHTGKWRRSRGSGPWLPVIVAGPGEDVPCPFEAVTNAVSKRRQRVKIKRARAIEAAAEQVRRQEAAVETDKVVARTRTVPQTWFSALIPQIEGGARVATTPPLP